MNRLEALKKIRQMSLPKETLEILEALAPELHESEDERIRKFICSIIDNLEPKDFVGVKKMDVLAYLEKQKEQKPFLSPEKKEYVRQLKALVSDFVRDKKPKDVEFYQRIWNWLDGLNGELIPID